MRQVVLAAILVLVGTHTARSNDSCPAGYKRITVTETRTVYEIRTVQSTKEVTKYDHCGKPYTVCVTCYKEVEVPVKKYCTYIKLVKICDCY